MVHPPAPRVAASCSCLGIVALTCVVALTSAAVGLPASRGEAVPGPGAPTTCEESRKQFVANGNAAEKVAEQLARQRLQEDRQR